MVCIDEIVLIDISMLRFFLKLVVFLQIQETCNDIYPHTPIYHYIRPHKAAMCERSLAGQLLFQEHIHALVENLFS